MLFEILHDVGRWVSLNKNLYTVTLLLINREVGTMAIILILKSQGTWLWLLLYNQ